MTRESNSRRNSMRLLCQRDDRSRFLWLTAPGLPCKFFSLPAGAKSWETPPFLFLLKCKDAPTRFLSSHVNERINSFSNGKPGETAVVDEFRIDWGTYMSSHNDVIYIRLDVRGAKGQGKKKLYRHLGGVEVADQIAVIEWVDYMLGRRDDVLCKCLTTVFMSELLCQLMFAL